MGAANCCKKPDEIVIEEVKYSPTDNNKFTAIDQDSYPKDTEQVYKSNVKSEEEGAQNQVVSNQNLYEQDGGSPKIGGAYEVAINDSNPQQMYEEGYKSNQMGQAQLYENTQFQNAQEVNINQYEQDDQAAYQYVENQKLNENNNQQMTGNAYGGIQEEEGIDYNDLVNQVGNEANLKALRLANAGLNTASASAAYAIQQSQQAALNNYNIQKNNNLNTLSSAQQQGELDLKALSQQGGNNGAQITTTKKVEYSNMGPTGQQTTTTTTTTINKQIGGSQRNESEDLSQYFQQATSKFGSVNVEVNQDNEKYYSKSKTTAPGVDLKQLSYSTNVQVPGGLDLEKLLQKDNVPTQTKVTKVTSVKQISPNEDISKYFKQTNSSTVNQSNLPAKIKPSSNMQISVQEGPADIKKEQKISKAEIKTSEEPITDDLNQIKITKIELDMDDLPETFGSSNIANFKQTTTTTTTKTTGNDDQPGQTTTTTTTKTVENIDMKDLPEVFGSFDINKYKKPETEVKKDEINIEKNDNNNFKQTTITTTIGNLDMNDLPEVFGSSDINNFKQTTTTTTTKTTGNDDLKDFNIDLKNYKLEMNDLPEVFGSSDISHFKQTTTTTTTTKKEGGDAYKKVDNNDFKQITTTTTTEGIIDMKDLPEVFGSSDINNFKQITTTTTTTKNEGGDLQKKPSNQLDDFKQITTTTKEIIDMKDLPEVFGSSDINNFKQTKVTTTTTTTKKEGEDLEKKESNQPDKNDFKQITTTTTTEGIINMKDLPEVFGSFNIANFKPITTTEGKVDIKEMANGPETANLKNVKQTTVTTTKEGNIDLKNLPEGFDFSNIDKAGIIEMKDLPEVFGSSNINNFKQTTTTKTTTGALDIKDLPETFDSSDINNFKQTTTTTTTTGVLDMKDLPETFGSSNIANYKQTQTKTTTIKTTTGNAPIDLNKFSLEKNASAISPDGKTVSKTTVTKTTVANAPIDLKQFGIEQNPSASPITGAEDYSKYFQETTQTTSEPIDLKQFGIEQNPSALSNLKQVTKTTKTTKTETSNAGNIDLKQFGIEQNPSASPITGKEDYSKYFQTSKTTTTSGPIDLKQFGIEQNPSASPITGNEDYSKYFQTTKTTTTKTNGPVDLKQFGIDMNSVSGTGGLDLKSLGLEGGKTTTTTTITKTENVGGDPALGGIDLKSFGLDNNTQQKTTTTTTKITTTGNASNLPTSSEQAFTTNYTIPNASTNNEISFGKTQNAASSSNSYGTQKVTTTKVTKSYVGPTQSYSYNYSYNMPATGSTTVTKTTYSGALPGKNV